MKIMVRNKGNWLIQVGFKLNLKRVGVRKIMLKIFRLFLIFKIKAISKIYLGLLTMRDISLY